MRSLVLSIFLYDCGNRVREITYAFEMRCYRRLLNVSYKDYITNEEVPAVGEYNDYDMVKNGNLGSLGMSQGLLV